MIFVTLGTQNFQFTRLMNLIYQYSLKTNEQIYIQSGYTKIICDHENVSYTPFLSPDEYNAYLTAADLVITHAGTSSIVKALNANKRVLCCPRLSIYKEHVDNHQIEIASAFEKEGYITVFNDRDVFEEKVGVAIRKPFKKYVSNKKELISDLNNYLLQ